MRHLRSYDDREQAQGLSDELEAQGIENQVRSDKGPLANWVLHRASQNR